jgi:nucleotide-binding universal stress UspA family protein
MLTSIICATDLSHRSDRALERAAQLAEQHNLPLHVVNVIDPELPDTLWQAQKEQVHQEIRAALGRIASPAHERAIVKTLVGTPSREIAVYASELENCLIVLGYPRIAEGGRVSFGSFSAGRILSAAVAPVLIVKAHGNAPYRKAVVGIDLSPFSTRAALLAAELVPDGEVTLVQAYEVPYKGFLRGEATRLEVEASHKQKLEELVASLAASQDAARLGSSALSSAKVREGEVHQVLRSEVARTGAELLVLGTHGRSGLSRALFGSVAEDMLLEMPSDLLIAVPS